MGRKKDPSVPRFFPSSRLLSLLAALLLILSPAAANRAPKFPRSHDSDSTLVLHPTSSNVNQNQSVSSVQLSAKSSPQSTEVTSGTTLSALNIAGKNHTSNETNHLVGTHGKNHTSNETQPNHLVGTQGKLAVKVPENETAKNEETVRWDPFQPNPSDFEIEDKDEEETVVVKSRLRPMDVFHKGAGENNTLAAKVMKGTHHQQKYNITELRLKRTRNLDVVITHFDPSRTEQMVDYWLAFLQRKRVSALKPYVFIYCQNEHYDLNEDDFKPILQLGGEVVHLPNVGRESHGFLEHITSHFGDLADHTIFAQDISSDTLPDRFDKLFEKKTGFLPLSLVGHVDCETGQSLDFLPRGVIPQIYSMFAKELCPPVGYTSSFEGQFVVSRQRIKDQSWWTYRKLLDLLSADESHWIHDRHDNPHYKSRSNPMFGHVLERTWSVAFNCYESWREGNCWECLEMKGMNDCGPGACQCFDS